MSLGQEGECGGPPSEEEGTYLNPEIEAADRRLEERWAKLNALTPFERAYQLMVEDYERQYREKNGKR